VRVQGIREVLCFFLCVGFAFCFVATHGIVSLEVLISLGSQYRIPTGERFGSTFSEDGLDFIVAVIDRCGVALRWLFSAVDMFIKIFFVRPIYLAADVFSEVLTVRPSPGALLIRDIDFELVSDCCVEAGAGFVIPWTFRSLRMR